MRSTMRKIEKMNKNPNAKKERNIYSGERNNKYNKPKRGRRD